ncbi:MAG: ribonuclease M5 [Acholeplasmataceae bacterium]
MKPKLLVVEGAHDIARIRQVDPDVRIISVNGSAIDDDSKTLIRRLQETHDIVLFLDPDHAGERIRRLLEHDLGSVHHVFVEQRKARSPSGKVGVEHLSNEEIRKALSDIRFGHVKTSSDVTTAFLHRLKLIGHPYSARTREALAKSLNLGHVNGKTLLKRIRMFNITEKQIEEALHGTPGQKEVRTKLHPRQESAR